MNEPDGPLQVSFGRGLAALIVAVLPHKVYTADRTWRKPVIPPRWRDEREFRWARLVLGQRLRSLGLLKVPELSAVQTEAIRELGECVQSWKRVGAPRIDRSMGKVVCKGLHIEALAHCFAAIRVRVGVDISKIDQIG